MKTKESSANLNKGASTKLRVNKEFLLTFLFSVLSALLGLVFNFLSARFLGANRFGEIHYYLSISAFLSTIMLFGTDNFMIKKIQFATNKNNEFTRIFAFFTISSILTLPVYFFIAYFFLNKLEQNFILIFLIFSLAFFSSVATLVGGFFTGLDKNQINTLLKSVLPHLALILLLLIHFATNSLESFVSNYMLYYIVIYFLIILPFLIKHIKKTNISISKSELKTLLLFTLTWITYNLTGPISNIIVGERYNQFEIVGILTVSNQLLTVAGIVSGIIVSISYPVFARLVKENKKKELKKYFETVTRVNMYIGIPFYIAFACESTQLFLFFGESYTNHNLILILLSLSSYIECITGPCGSVLLMGGKEKENLIASTIKFVVFLATILLLINHTIYASPIAMVLGTLCGNIAKLIFLYKFTHENYFNKNIIIPCLAITLICFSVFFGLSFIKNLVFWSISNCVCGLGLIISFLLFSPYKNDKLFLLKNKNQTIS